MKSSSLWSSKCICWWKMYHKREPNRLLNIQLWQTASHQMNKSISAIILNLWCRTCKISRHPLVQDFSHHCTPYLSLKRCLWKEEVVYTLNVYVFVMLKGLRCYQSCRQNILLLNTCWMELYQSFDSASKPLWPNSFEI